MIEEAAYDRRTKGPDPAKALVLAPLLSATPRASDLARADLVIEAIVEKEDAKKALYAELEPLLGDSAILASNTSTIPITKLAKGLRRPDRFCGLHFFNPVRRMKLVEVIRGEATSDETFYFVPEPHTDSIASVLGERFGLLGWGALLGLFLALVWRCLVVAQSTREPFGRLIAIGIAALLGTQALINTAMLVGLLPITGITLPLMSYGGSSLLATSLAIGLVINVAIRPGYHVAGLPFRFSSSPVRL